MFPAKFVDDGDVEFLQVLAESPERTAGVLQISETTKRMMVCEHLDWSAIQMQAKFKNTLYYGEALFSQSEYFVL